MIDISGWKEFRIGDYFEIFHGVRLTKNKREEGDIPLLTAGYENQGVAEYINNPEMPRYINSITVDMFGNCFYHDGVYTGDDNIYFFINDDISHYAKLFLSSMITSVLQGHYDYGRQFRRGDADTLKVILPTTLSDEPDWYYMESYMKKVMEEAEEYIRIVGGHSFEKHSVDVNEWGEFRIGDLFDTYLSKDDIQPKNIVEGDVPLISSGKTNNGIVNYIDAPDAKLWDAGTITVDMFGKAFYQPISYHAVSHGRVNILIPKEDMSEAISIFIIAAIEQISYKYEFSDMCTGDKLANDIIKLPITPSGEPNWQYMEDLMKNITLDCEEAILKIEKSIL